MRIVQIYPRMIVGGVETHVLHLLRHIPAKMVIPGIAGHAAERAKALATSYVHIPPPTLAKTVRAIRGADIAHIHVTNNEPILAIAVQLAAPQRIVLTVHNTFAAEYARFADFSWSVGKEALSLLEAPGRVGLNPSGVPVPIALPVRTPCEGRPLRILEVRRPEKPMAWTLEDLLERGRFDDVPIEAAVAGVDGDAADPRVRRLGTIDDSATWMAWADIVVHGSAAEAYGRVPYEALAAGAKLVVTPLPAFADLLARGWAIGASEMGIDAGVDALRRAISSAHDPEPAHRWVRENASVERMVEIQKRGYAEVLAKPPAPRTWLPEDVADDALEPLGAVLNAAADRTIDVADFGRLPPSSRAIAASVLVRRKLVKPPDRVRLLKGAIATVGPRPGLLLALGGAAADIGDVELARKAYISARNADPGVITPTRWLLEYYRARGDTKAAAEEMERLSG